MTAHTAPGLTRRPHRASHPRPRTFTDVEASTWWAIADYYGLADARALADLTESDPVSVLTWCFAYQQAGLLAPCGLHRWTPTKTSMTLEAAERFHDLTWHPFVRRARRRAWARCAMIAAAKLAT